MRRISQFLITSLFAIFIIVASAQSDSTFVELKSVKSGKCLTVKGGSKKHGAGLMDQTCETGDPAAIWEMQLVEDARFKFYKIVNKNSGLCLGIAHGSNQDGARLKQVGPCNRADALWRIYKEHLTPKDYGERIALINKHSNKCLTRVGDGVLKQYGCRWDNDKFWWIFKEPPSYALPKPPGQNFYLIQETNFDSAELSVQNWSARGVKAGPNWHLEREYDSKRRGHIQAKDSGGIESRDEVWRFIASDAWLGPRDDIYGDKLTYWFKWRAAEPKYCWFEEKSPKHKKLVRKFWKPDVILRGSNGKEIGYFFPAGGKAPDAYINRLINHNDWVKYEVPLIANQSGCEFTDWDRPKKGAGEGCWVKKCEDPPCRGVVTETEFKEILKDLAAMEIRGEYCLGKKDHNVDRGFLDGIKIATSAVSPPPPIGNDDKAKYMRDYAPRIWFHSKERFWPSSVAWVLGRGKMKRYWSNHSKRWWLVTEKQPLKWDEFVPFFAGCPPVNFKLLPCTDRAVTGCKPGDKLEDTGCSLEFDVLIYAFWNQVYEDSATHYDIHYFLFFPYNLAKKFQGKFYYDHIGDWEHLTVRLQYIYSKEDKKWELKPNGLFLGRHGGDKGRTHPWKYVPKVPGSRHPVIYTANGSHGFYINEGRHVYEVVPIVGDLTDYTDKGFSWDTWVYPTSNGKEVPGIQMFDYDKKKTLGWTMGGWPSWMEKGYDDRTMNNPYDGPIWRWGNYRDGADYLGEVYHRVHGPKGPVDKPCFKTEALD